MGYIMGYTSGSLCRCALHRHRRRSCSP
jgi:hypothetical protein